MKTIELTVNGEAVQALVEPRTHLADFLREQQRLTGTHLGCEHGVCGACTVLVDGRPVRSCITYAVQCDGGDVRTVEGFEEDAVMAELRKAFSREYALQCGFCTPGMLIAARDLVLRLPGADERRIREEMSGNLCRCTGYVGIVRAISSVAQARGASNEASVADKPKAPASRFTPLERNVEAKARTPVSAGRHIEDEVIVRHPLDVVWAAFADMPAVAACLPGAELTESDENSVKGRISVKFGPMRASFAGGAALERDAQAKRGVIRGAGQDTLSASRARGDVVYRLAPAGTAATRIAISIDYSLQGPLAQFSRAGLVRELVARMVADFGTNLERRLGSGDARGPAREREVDLFAVLWAWFKSLFVGRESS